MFQRNRKLIMTDADLIPDAAGRHRALNPAQSFIVQAPAGSGKTGLLIQRYLRLLATVDAPEEVVAITFTRKAAAEMRERVLDALEAAKTPAPIADSAYEKLTRELSMAVLQRDEQASWQLVENPVRLRIQTIDSLCASLTRQMPMLSKFGAQPETIEDAAKFYLEAARATIALVEQDHAVAHDVEHLLEHLDNDVARIEMLLSEMLARRDHWLRHMHGRTRDELETALKKARFSALQHIADLFPEAMQNELFQLARYAAANLITDGKSSPITVCDGLLALPHDVEHWCGIAELLLTKTGDWRKTVDVRVGFPASKTKVEKEWKSRITTFIDALRSGHVLCQALHAMRLLPPPEYTDQQWEILGAITRLLPLAVAQLKIIFQACGKVDFTEVAQGALQALGDPEMPTDLALALDFRIKHLLIDEFQDTSISQYQLIEKLVAGWEEGDGHSLFAVGDPMQSIYRFREAEVGLFLQARKVGLGSLVLQPIILSANFRSQRGIIDWVNATFAAIMPVNEDIATGAVTYTSSVATHATLDERAVTVHPFFENNHVEEAEKVVEIISQSQHENPSGSIAILVRNRSHLNEIINKIKQAGLRFRAVEIEALVHKPVVQDLLTLTRALINPADRLAWLALLRAPWCGLTLTDLHALTVSEQKRSDDHGAKKAATVWAMLNEESNWQVVSADGKKRLCRVRKILASCILHRCRQSLRVTVEAAWQALGGPACADLSAQADAMLYLEYLEKHEEAGEIADINIFEEGLTKLYASPDLGSEDGLQIMTIHKSKGLEFDTVIVPGLARKPRNSDKQLLKWMERPGNPGLQGSNVGEADLLLAPIQETGVDENLIYKWIEKLDSEKELFEIERLLYVAATRAKKFLHLLGRINLATNKDGNIVLGTPAVNSLLGRLWPVVQATFNERMEQLISSDSLQLAKKEEAIQELIFNQSLCRLATGWELPSAPKQIAWLQPHERMEVQEEIEFSWVSEMARHTGNVVHRWLQQIAEDEMKGWDIERIQAMRDTFKHALIMSGMSGGGSELKIAVERIITALSNVINDQRGQWILGAQQHAQNELRMTGVINGEPVNLIIDRTFCDLQGNRWVIDYKTSSHEGSDIEGFLDREQERYHRQLNRYAEIIQHVDHRPVRLGLYFPLLNGWREWRK
jgi:ATP-dependent helicase/nuclease subunit A